MLIAFWLMSLKSKCSTARLWCQYSFQETVFWSHFCPQESKPGELKIGIFDADAAFSHKWTLQKHFKSFCAASNGECCTFVNLRSCHRMDLVFCSCWFHLVCSLCVSEHAWRKAGEVRLHADFLLPVSVFLPAISVSPHGYISSPDLFNCLVFTDFSSLQLVRSHMASLTADSGF